MPEEPIKIQVEVVPADTAQVSLRGTVSFSRTVNLGNYEKADAFMSLQFDVDNEKDSDEDVIQKAVDAFFVSKACVFQQLGIDFVLDESGVVVEQVRRAFNATIEPQQGGEAPAPAPAPESVGPNPPEKTGNRDADDAAVAKWALARLASHPSEFYDNRPKKASGEYKPNAADLKHKPSGRSIWLKGAA